MWQPLQWYSINPSIKSFQWQQIKPHERLNELWIMQHLKMEQYVRWLSFSWNLPHSWRAFIQSTVAISTAIFKYKCTYCTLQHIQGIGITTSIKMSSLQSSQVKYTPQDSLNKSVIWKMNPLVIATFKSAFLHA